MTAYRKDDRRYMTFEMRAADDVRYRGTTTAAGKATETCYCGKTVVAVHGRKTGATCPRECERDR